MNTCPACSAAVTDNSANCPSCGAVLGGTHATIRQSPPKASPKEQIKTPRSTSTSSRGEGSFLAGTVLNERYRVTGLLGRGGMGEVYRAEDLKLNQTVALKFLPDHFAEDVAARERFFGEVRTARQVSHPNVCRVFDIGDVSGSHFLSMEFIDGDDLSSLLRRIGRLPHDKALEIARQLCAGLHAVHQAGILHRDFKPANVMIDGRGKARLTDFGIAGLESDLKEGTVAGTPAYMSPEQITGKELTSKSDIYSLGLVLYEIFTGKPAFAGDTVTELLRKHKTATPTNPSEVVKDIDPVVEQVILRCLEKDAKKRPDSALQVALALPGGDPLQAALAMGETPSPEMVAAAGEKTGLRPMIALVCLMAIFACLVVLAFVGHRISLNERIPFENSPEILAGKSRETIAQLGYPERPVDKAYGLAYDGDYLGYRDKDNQTDSSAQLGHGREAAVYFWYRESPIHLLREKISDIKQTWSVSETDPSQSMPGLKGLKLDTLGRLREFYARLPELDEGKSAELTTPDWNRPFVLAGLDTSRFTTTEARWNPESAFDTRAAWTGTVPEMPETTLRVEAAGYRGKVVFFKLISPWTMPSLVPVQRSSAAFELLFPAALVFGAALLAWRNYRQGRGDRQGAIKLAFLSFVFGLLFWLLTGSHVPTTGELDLLGQALRSSLLSGAMLWALYIALEPYVRRHWPSSLITWSRLMTAKFTDPLVGRDFLIGILLGACFTLLASFPYLLMSRVDAIAELDPLLGITTVIGVLLNSMSGAVLVALVFTFLFTLLRSLLRRDWLAAVIAIMILATPSALSGSVPSTVSTLILGALLVLAFTRFGLLNLFVSLFIFFWLNGLPFTTNLSAWYAFASLSVMFLIFALAGFAFYTSLGGQKVFQGKLLEE
jgi:Protein kinase domain